MRAILILGLATCVLPAARAVQVGDTYEAVLAEKGEPLGRVDGGDRLSLRYADQTIRLRGGQVVGVDIAAVPPVKAAEPGDAAVGPNPGGAPTFPKSFVGNPEFQTVVGTKSAGTAFLAKRRDDARVFLVTVRHLLGPAGGFEQDVPADRVPSFVRRIRLESLWGGARLYTVRGLAIPAPSDPEAAAADLAIFLTESASASDALPLAAEVPEVGRPVWVVAHVRGGVAPGTLLHRATARGMAAGFLLCEFENPEIVTNGASGAPVVDANGAVVGVYRGHSRRGGKKYAHVVPAPLLLTFLPGS